MPKWGAVKSVLVSIKSRFNVVPLVQMLDHNSIISYSLASVWLSYHVFASVVEMLLSN